MPLSFLNCALLALPLAVIGCSEVAPEPKVEAYVTNAEYVLERLEVAKTSGVAFQVKPIRNTACKYMYLEIGKKSAEGSWETTNTDYPGKDNRNNFGETVLEDQIHFMEVDGFGEFGVLALGCAPYGEELQVIRAFLASFKVEYGKLNYIGEIALVPAGQGGGKFAHIKVEDRSEFGLNQIQSKLPALGAYFQSNVMEKFVPELSPETQAAFDEFAKRQKAEKKKQEFLKKEMEKAKPVIEARQLVLESILRAEEALDLWDANNGYPRSGMSDMKLAERRVLKRKRGILYVRLDKYDEMLETDMPYDAMLEYMELHVAADQAREALRDKFPSSTNLSGIKESPESPEFVALKAQSRAANKAKRDFAKLYDL